MIIKTLKGEEIDTEKKDDISAFILEHHQKFMEENNKYGMSTLVLSIPPNGTPYVCVNGIGETEEETRQRHSMIFGCIDKWLNEFGLHISKLNK